MFSKIFNSLLHRKIIVIVAIAYCSCLVACHTNNDILQPNETIAVQDSVATLARAIAKDVTLDGPVAWLRYFDSSANFFMASGGELQFANYDSAKNFINNTLVKSISKIELHWTDIRIDPLTLKLAGMAATFHENITDASGKQFSFNGYFTATAKQTPQGWKLHNLHWSMLQ